jgi:hypothetical protein
MDMILRIRKSDNVLDESFWPEREVLVRDGRIVSMRTRSYGVYGWIAEHDPMVGWTLEKLCVWTERDDTGKHPETFHEIYVSGEWLGFVSPDMF